MTHTTSRRTERRSTRRTKRIAAAALAAGALVAGTAVASTGLVAPGTPGKDVTFGGDNDNADNTFIQPPGVTAKQHMDNTDVLFGRANDDLLVGKLGGDTLLGGEDSDILIGGPEKAATPNSDVLIGEEGKDINIWAPGDGSDAFAGNEGKDTMIFAPFVEKSNGSLLITRENGRKIPHVDIDGQAAFSCTIVEVPASEKLGFQFLVRFNVNGTPVVTVRQKEVEKVFCPSPDEGKVRVARLTAHHPTFKNIWLSRVHGTVGAIMAPVV
ncbi:MAG: calcium-binding protein [Nocardioides sp.]